MKQIIYIVTTAAILYLLYRYLTKNRVSGIDYNQFDTGLIFSEILHTPEDGRYYDNGVWRLKGSGKKNMQSSIVKVVKSLQKRLQFPVVINSGYRSEQYNAHVNGVPGSAHTKGYAVDIKTRSKQEQQQLIREAMKLGVNRFGVYSSFIHIDTDPSKPQRSAWRFKQSIDIHDFLSA